MASQPCATTPACRASSDALHNSGCFRGHLTYFRVQGTSKPSRTRCSVTINAQHSSCASSCGQRRTRQDGRKRPRRRAEYVVVSHARAGPVEMRSSLCWPTARPSLGQGHVGSACRHAASVPVAFHACRGWVGPDEDLSEDPVDGVVAGRASGAKDPLLVETCTSASRKVAHRRRTQLPTRPISALKGPLSATGTRIGGCLTREPVRGAADHKTEV
jgi:hypothetical protein